MLSLFWTSFFNSAIVLMLSTANFKSYWLHKLIPLEEQFPDQTSNWYLTIGPALIQTEMILSISPFINWFVDFFVRLLLRFCDSGCSCCSAKPRTKVVTVTQYVELYSG